jgi:hypothetical protein
MIPSHVFLFALVAALGLGAAQGNAQNSSPRNVALRVKVCAGGSGRPAVWVSSTPHVDLRARTQNVEENGEFRVLSQADAPLYVVSAAPGCAIDARRVAADAAEIALVDGRDVAFHMRDADGPVAGFVERSLGEPAVVVVTHADADGQGVLIGLRPDAENVTARFQQVSAVVRIAPIAGSVVLTLPPIGAITGLVTDQNGRPIRDAVLTLVRNQARAVLVGETGAFSAEQLAGGDYTLEAGAEGFRFQSLEVHLEKRQRARVAIRMVPGAQVRVQLMTPAGEPVRKPRLEVESNNAMGFDLIDLMRPRRVYVGGENGTVDIRGLPLGVSQLVLNTPPFARLRLPPIEIREFTPEIDLGTIVAGEGATLAATVKSASGEARAGVSVRLDRGPGVSAADPAVAETDANGRASIGRLGPGRYRVRVGGDERPGGTGPFAEEWIRVSETDTRINRTFSAGGVALSITASNQLGPIRASRVSVMPGLGDEPEVEGMVVQTPNRLINAPFNPGIRSVTDEAGRATLLDVPTGPARLSVGLSGASWSMPITVGPTDSEMNVFVPSVHAELFVKDAATGMAVPARVTWTSQTQVRVAASADAAGRVTLEGLVDGPASLEFQSRDHARVSLSLSGLSAIPAEVVMDRNAQTTLTVHLSLPDGTPVTGASAELVQATAKRWKRIAVSRDDGTLRFTGIESAAGRLAVRHALFATTAIDLPATGPETVGLVLRPGYRTVLRVIDEDRPSATSDKFEVSLLRHEGSSLLNASEDVYPRTAGVGDDVDLGLLATGSYRAVLRSPAREIRCDFTVDASPVVVGCPQ